MASVVLKKYYCNWSSRHLNKSHLVLVLVYLRYLYNLVFQRIRSLMLSYYYNYWQFTAAARYLRQPRIKGGEVMGAIALPKRIFLRILPKLYYWVLYTIINDWKIDRFWKYKQWNILKQSKFLKTVCVINPRLKRFFVIKKSPRDYRPKTRRLDDDSAMAYISKQSVRNT